MVLWLRNGEEHQRASGEWANGRLHGLAVWEQTEGHRYEGQWNNGRKHGVGTYIWPSGQQYKGTFENDERSGGILLKADGTPINPLKSASARKMMFDATEVALRARSLASNIRHKLIEP